MSRTALIAGEGSLAPAIAAALDRPLVYALDHLHPQVEAKPFRLERLVPFLDELAEQGVTRAVFAGAIRRPRIEPDLFDPRTMAIVPRILMGMQSGDDAALRAVLDVFEEAGIAIASVVAGMQTVGAFLVIALVVTPGATAYLLTDRFPRLLALAVAIGAGTSALGAYLSYFLDGATGGIIVLLQTALFVAAFVLAPTHGLLAARARARAALKPHPAARAE